MAFFQPFFKHWKIYQKIGSGYGVAIAIGFIGSLAGLVVADYFQGRAVFRLADAQQQSQLLESFERAAEAFHLHSTRLSLLEVGSDRFEEQYLQMQTNLVRIEVLKQEIDDYLYSDPFWLAAPPATFSQLIQTYAQQLSDSSMRVEQLVQASSKGGVVQPKSIQEQLRDIAVNEEALATDLLHAQLIRVIDDAHAQEYRASTELESAQGLEKLIIVLSIIGSATIAGVTAWQTTRAIAQPLEELTQVAQDAAQHDTFDAKANVVSDDEIGMLAQSFNALIEQVSQRTKALEQSVAEANHQTKKIEHTVAVLRRTQTQLVQTEKMSSLGQMVAGVAHEINNPVSFIYGNIDYVKQYVYQLLTLIEQYEQAFPQQTDQIREYEEAIDLDFLRRDLPKLLASLNVGAERIRSLVLSLRIFSRLDESEVKSVDLHEGIDSTLVILGNRLKAQYNRPAIHVIKDYGALPTVECRPGHLNQVFMNVLANAVDALDERYAREQAAQASGDADYDADWRPVIKLQTRERDGQICINITDNGIGMPEGTQAKIFDPFFTTKPIGKGTGLGMSISYEIIVKKHLGSINAWSSAGQGTTFHIQLPIKLSDRQQPAIANLKVS
ncbi:MAG: ATP-binding protein [Cyanobacteria bacterium J06638_20]